MCDKNCQDIITSFPSLTTKYVTDTYRVMGSTKTCLCIHQICNYQLGRWLQWDPFHHICCGMLMTPTHLSYLANTSQTCCGLDSEGLGLNRNSTGQGTAVKGTENAWYPERSYTRAKENEVRDRIPLTSPSSHENFLKSILGPVSYCVDI